MKPDKNRARGIGFYLLIGVIILAVIFYLTTPAEQKEYTYSEIEELFRQEQVKSFCLEGDELTLNLYSPDSDGNTTIKKTLPSPTWFREDLGDLIEEQTASGVLTEYDYVKGWTAPWWMSILPYLISIVLFIGVWYLLMNKAGGGGAPGVGKFGKAHTRTGEENLKKVTFADVAGAEEEKTRLFLELWVKKEAYVKYTGEGLKTLAAVDTTTLSGRFENRSDEQHILYIYYP